MSETFSSIGSSSGLLVYLDNIVLASPSWTHHKQLINTVLSMLQDVRVTLKPSKAQFGSKQIHYLGHDVCPRGIAVSQARIEAILDTHASSSNCERLTIFFGFYELYHKDISSRWNRPQQTAFDECNDFYLGLQCYTFLIFLRNFLFM
ncbi:unnamed protein product [Choristocarpus tenellus]